MLKKPAAYRLFVVALIAALLDMKFRKAFPAVIIGVCLATVIMTTISYVIPGFFF